MSNRKIAIVTWLDAYFSDTLPKEVNLQRETAGFLIQNNKRVVRIALTLDERGPSDMMSIPRGMVRELKILELKGVRHELPEDEVEPSDSDVENAKDGY